ncbi:response regulator transcription factor [Roseivirga misakiensis]|uniref:DNA-binding response regulator n=1 Tax=Roseivirga misakiensis TaxID=1563681 RepID=A0A1E5T734_9BACT|nr:response regulator transcription factor [Roseivirga misakiensis]OEK07107.1 DNA-binding response regulator [Roseivirga misakiensis]
MEILVIEDEAKLAALIKEGLEKSDYIVTVETNGSNGIATAINQTFDLILLDIMLPDQSGFDVLQAVRANNIITPIIFLSALNESKTVIKGLDYGAVDYIKKPFDFDELRARIRNVQRKFGSDRVSILELEGVKVDLIKREVFRANKKIELSKREFAILELLLTHANRPLSKAEITEKIWNINFDMGTNVIEVHMHQLRKKLNDGFEKQLIETIVGSGYQISGVLIKR